MKKMLIFVILVLFCSGCWQTVDITEIKKAEQFCSDKMGVKIIDEFWNGKTCITCVNGEYEYDFNITLKGEKENEKN